ncbi:MAG: hypothetical protein PWR02_531 [Synergistales bacterium]|nr:hypothetical protein [Synergistales bacterium]
MSAGSDGYGHLIRKAAVVLWAGAFLIAGAKAEAGVTVSGVPGWLEAPVKRSLEAVWKEVVQRSSPGRERVVELVAKRLFPGLDISEIQGTEEDLFVSFDTKESERLSWNVVVKKPELPGFLERSFLEDASGLETVATEMLDSLPLDVIRWAGEDFQAALDEFIVKNLPGWKPSYVFSSRGEKGALEMAFTPREPVVIAFSPRLSSRTLPLVLQSKLYEETLDVTSQVVGLPAAWVTRHEKSIEAYIAASLEERWAARELEGKVEVNIRPDRIAPVDVQVESSRYTLQAWLGVYAGSDERHPEAGIHAGRIIQPFSGWEIEAYGEFIIKVNDGDVDPRAGLRWKFDQDIWIGVERSFEDDEYWGRIWFDEILPKLYAWGRFREDGESEAALGWMIGEHLSWELYYDSRDGEDLSLRITGNL